MSKSKNRNTEGWVGVAAVGAIAAAGVAMYSRMEKPIDDPDFYKLRNPSENIRETRVTFFTGVGDASQFFDVENVEINLLLSHLKGLGACRFFEFLTEDILPLRLENDATFGDIKISVETLGDLIIPAGSTSDVVARSLIDFFSKHKEVLMIADQQLERLQNPPAQQRIR